MQSQLPEDGRVENKGRRLPGGRVSLELNGGERVGEQERGGPWRR